MDVVAAINAARLVLTVDTGVVHVCSALDKPIVAFYRGLDNIATAFDPLSTWHLVIRPPPGRIASDISPDEAIAKTRRHGLPPPF